MSADVSPSEPPTLGPGRGLPVVSGSSASRCRIIGVAIPIPDPHGPLLQSKRAEFNDPLAHAIPAHVTLLGPTEVTDEGLPGLVSHLADVASVSEPFDVVLRGTGTFRPVSDVVFVQVARGISGCERLEQRIRSGRYGGELAFPYHPHVTVAHDVADEDLDRAFEDLADFQVAFPVDAFWLYEQDVDGAWTPVRSFRLAGTR
jgi:2'-5' RNA ligase